MDLTLLQAVLMCAAFLCSLVAGFLFAFAAVVMPGIRSLNDGDFIRAFQVIDRVIQNNQPLFVFVWIGSVLAMIAVAVAGVWQLRGADRLLVILVALVYLLGVQWPTVAINIPLNNTLQTLDLGTLSEAMQKQARADFERRWNRWNDIRATCATVVSILLMVLLVRV
jgi:uncharacterized membrane protein